MELKVDEISKIIRQRIEGFESQRSDVAKIIGDQGVFNRRLK